MRRVDFVRLLIEEKDVRAQLVGVGFRLPTFRPVPLSYAAKLISQGTPSVAHDLRNARPFEAEEAG